MESGLTPSAPISAVPLQRGYWVLRLRTWARPLPELARSPWQQDRLEGVGVWGAVLNPMNEMRIWVLLVAPSSVMSPKRAKFMRGEDVET